jgi:hypothetical protein
VAGAGDRQELGQALDDAHDGGLDQQNGVHAHSHNESADYGGRAAGSAPGKVAQPLFCLTRPVAKLRRPLRRVPTGSRASRPDHGQL